MNQAEHSQESENTLIVFSGTLQITGNLFEYIKNLSGIFSVSLFINVIKIFFIYAEIVFNTVISLITGFRQMTVIRVYYCPNNPETKTNDFQ
jgi:hypothetical protein